MRWNKSESMPGIPLVVCEGFFFRGGGISVNKPCGNHICVHPVKWLPIVFPSVTNVAMPFDSSFGKKALIEFSLLGHAATWKIVQIAVDSAAGQIRASPVPSLKCDVVEGYDGVGVMRGEEGGGGVQGKPLTLLSTQWAHLLCVREHKLVQESWRGQQHVLDLQSEYGPQMLESQS